MSGTILENLSNKKLSVVIAVILLIQFISFLIGAFIAPAPASAEQLSSWNCIADNPNELSIPRDSDDKPRNCRRAGMGQGIENANVTFAFQLPLPRGQQKLDYSRWMQNLITVVIPELVYDKRVFDGDHRVSKTGDVQVNASIVMKVRLAVKNRQDKEWKLYAVEDELKRSISCKIAAEHRKQGYKYDCDMIQLFELQSLHYDLYLINIQFVGETQEAQNLGLLQELTLVAIHQNGGFSKVWLSLKSFFFIVTLMTLAWYWNRLAHLRRETTLLERIFCFLGVALSLLNTPFELITLFFDVPLMSFFSDLRQGIFYCALLSTWIIFTGEHLLDGAKRSRLSSYCKHLSVVIIASLALFCFDLLERGVQAFYPFFTIWQVDSTFAHIFIATAAIASAAYFLFLCYEVWLVMRNISTKQNTLPSMSSTRRLIYQGIIYRFKFLLLATIVCAAATITAYIMGQVGEERLRFDDLSDDAGQSQIEATSAMYTTVYAMWNCYVITLLILYAPSHKHLDSGAVDNMSEEIEFNRLTDGKIDDENRHTSISESVAAASSRDEASGMKLLQDLATKHNIE